MKKISFHVQKFIFISDALATDGFYTIKYVNINKSQKRNKMSKGFEFQTFANHQVKGYMQTVSQDGSIVVYRNEEYFFVYYFDGEKIIEGSFPLEGYMSLQVPEKFVEENQAFKSIYAKIVQDKAVIFILSSDKLKIARIEIEDYGGGKWKINEQHFESQVLDIAQHPLKDCLVVLVQTTYSCIFDENLIKQPISISTDISNAEAIIHTSKLFVTSEHSKICSYFVFSIVESQDQNYLQISKAQERISGDNDEFSDFSEIEAISWPAFPCDFFEVFDYQEDQGLFCLVCDYLDYEMNRRFYSIFYVDTEMQAKWINGRITSYRFHSFLENNRIMNGHYSYQNIQKLHWNEICILPYEIESEKVSFNSIEENCKQQSFDRIAVWKMNEQMLLLRNNDHQLIISRQSFDDVLTKLKVSSFSIKNNQYLIVDQLGQLQFLQWKQIPEQDDEQPGILDESISLTFLLIIGGLSFLIVVLIGFLIWYCCRRKRQQKQQQKTEVRRQEAMNMSPIIAESSHNIHYVQKYESQIKNSPKKSIKKKQRKLSVSELKIPDEEKTGKKSNPADQVTKGKEIPS